MKMCRSVQNEYSPNKYQLLTCQMSSVSSNIFVVRIVNRYSILHTTTKTHYRKVSNNNIYNIYLVRFIKKNFSLFEICIVQTISSQIGSPFESNCALRCAICSIVELNLSKPVLTYHTQLRFEKQYTIWPRASQMSFQFR